MYRASGPNPARDWRIALIVFCIATLGSLAFSMYVFLEDVSPRSGIPGTGRPTEETVDRDGLLEVLTVFAEKERRLEGLQNSRPSVVDPSL